MRKQSLLTVFFLAACILAVAVAAFGFTRNNTTDICSAAEEQTENIKPLNGQMLWESLSRQFVSSVKY